MIGRAATDICLRTRYGISLLAISHQGQRSIHRFRTTPIMAGAVLLMQGAPEAFTASPPSSGACRLPPARYGSRTGTARSSQSWKWPRLLQAPHSGCCPPRYPFASGVLAYMALRVISPRAVYEAVNWPVIVLLGALIPVTGAMATTGAANLLVRLLLESLAQGQAIAALVLILVVTMTLSGLMNNAATATVMYPICISAAEQLGVNPDSFLVAVAIGASCAFLTPIGHQNNTLILGPGGFRLGDYWRLGLPL